MKTAAIVLLVVSVAILGRLAFLESRQLRQRRLNAQVASMPRNGSLDLQAKCAAQSDELFKESWAVYENAGFTDHYNRKLNRCFILVQYTETLAGTLYTYKELVDAFEGTDYGHYSWHTEKDKYYWNVAPTKCTVVLPSGEEKMCHDSDEFKLLVKAYMGE